MDKQIKAQYKAMMYLVKTKPNTFRIVRNRAATSELYSVVLEQRFGTIFSDYGRWYEYHKITINE